MKDITLWNKYVNRLSNNDKKLTSLDLSRWELNSQDLKLLADSLQENNQNLHELNLCNVKFGNDGLRVLCQILLKCSNLTTLNLHKNNIDNDAANYFLDLLLQHPTLHTLSLGDNAIGDVGVKILCETLSQKQNFFALYLGDCALSAQGIDYISDFLRHDPCLHTLAIGTSYLDGRCVDDVGAGKLGEALITNKHLARFYLCGNPFTDLGVQALMQGLCQNQTLMHLDLSGCNLSYSTDVSKKVSDLLKSDQYSLVRVDGLAQAQLERVLSRNRTLAEMYLSAAQQGDVEKLNEAIKKGVSLWVPDTFTSLAGSKARHYTALHYAAENGHVNVVHTLIQKGLSAYLNYTAAQSALEVAQHNRQTSIIEYFNTGAIPTCSSSEKINLQFSEQLRQFQLFNVSRKYTPSPVRSCFIESLKEFSSFLPEIKSVKAFISYAWEQDSNRNAKLQKRLQMLKDDLAMVGVYVMLDIRDIEDNISKYMKDGIQQSDVIFLIGTPRLKERLEETNSKRNNAQIEFDCIQQKMNQNLGHVLPLLFEGDYDTSFPDGVKHILIRDCRIKGENEWEDINYYYNYFTSLTSLVNPLGIIPVLFDLNQKRNEKYMSRYQFAVKHFETQLEMLSSHYAQPDLTLIPRFN